MMAEISGILSHSVGPENVYPATISSFSSISNSRMPSIGEQLRKIYGKEVLSVVEKRNYWSKEELRKVPSVDEVDIDLKALTKQVALQGGADAVDSCSGWSDIAFLLGVQCSAPPAIVGQLREIYFKFMKPFIQPEPAFRKSSARPAAPPPPPRAPAGQQHSSAAAPRRANEMPKQPARDTASDLAASWIQVEQQVAGRRQQPSALASGYYAQHEASGHSEWGQGQGMALESAQRHPSPSPASAPAWQPQEPPVWRTPPDTMAGAGGWAPPGAGPPPAILRRPPPHLVAPSTAGHPAAAAAHAAHMAALYPAAGPPRGTPAGGPKDAAASKKRRRPATREANAGGVSAGGVDAQGSLGGGAGRSAAPAGAGGGRAGRAPRGGAGVKKVGSAKGTAAHQSAVQGVTWNRSKACWEVTDHDGAGRKKRKTFSVKTYRTVEAARARAEAFRRQQLAEKFERSEIMKSSGTGGVPGAEPGEGTAAHSYYPDPATVGAGAGAYHGGLHSAGMALGPGGQASTQQQQQGVGYV